LTSKTGKNPHLSLEAPTPLPFPLWGDVGHICGDLQVLR